MFRIEVCEARQIALVLFHGQLTEGDFAALEAIGRAAKDGPGYDVVYDMTAVEQSDLATDFVSRRGSLPQANPHRRRLYVVPHDDLRLLVRLYAAYQAAAGWPSPVIVDTLHQVLDQLEIERSEFKPYPLQNPEADSGP